MRRKFPHILRMNAGMDFPQYFVFLDTETTPIQKDKVTQELKLKLGVAESYRRLEDGTMSFQHRAVLLKNEDFYAFLEANAPKGRRTFVVAHNIGFDMQVLDLVRWFKDADYRRLNTFMSPAALLLKYRKGKRRKARNVSTIVVFDNMNIFHTSLAKLGDAIGMPKLEHDFENMDQDELYKYCLNDVHIMVKAWEIWHQFIMKHKAGNFAYTLAGQSFNAYRHSHLTHKIWIHTNERAVKLERAAYHGGRTEVFFLGEAPRRQYYKLDVNSMYPSVMHEHEFPVKLIMHTTLPKKDLFERHRKSYLMIATVELDTPVNAFPYVHDGKLVFPTGRFVTSLCSPELDLALRLGVVKSVKEYAIYSGAPIFRSFVGHYYNLRKKYRKDGNETFAWMTKLMLNSLYGKFGQLNDEWERDEWYDDMKDGLYDVMDSRNGGMTKVRIIGGEAERSVGKQEALSSFPAVAAFVTSYARALLYDYITKAGPEHVFYVDTDSLIVDDAGYGRLHPLLDAVRLGKLKLEDQDSFLVIHGLKDYAFHEEVHRKGMRSNAEVLTPNDVVQDQFRSFRGAVRDGDHGHMIIRRVKKHFSRDYSKGIVTPSGRVEPLHLDLPSGPAGPAAAPASPTAPGSPEPPL